MTSFDPHPVEWTPEKVARYWDYLATHDACEFFSEKSATDLASRVRRLGPRRYVDIGCGTGPLVAEVARHGIECWGIDSAPLALAAARTRAPTATFELGSITSLPLPDQYVNVASLIEVVEHLDDATLAAALIEAHRVLRPGGTLMITTPNDEDLSASTRECPDCGCQFHTYQHVRSWTLDSLRRALLEAAFDEVTVRPVAFAEGGSLFGRLLPFAYRVLRRKPPRLLAFAAR